MDYKRISRIALFFLILVMSIFGGLYAPKFDDDETKQQQPPKIVAILGFVALIALGVLTFLSYA